MERDRLVTPAIVGTLAVLPGAGRPTERDSDGFRE
jgi:hypothetical protein